MKTSSFSLTKTLTTHHLSFHHTLSSTHNSFSFLSLSPTFPKPSSTTKKITAQKPNHNNNGSIRVKGKKENVWSVDNDLAKASSSQKEKKERGRKKMVKRNKGKKGGRVIVTGAMLMEVETVLQTQDGSYSRGPVDISVGKDDDSKYYVTPTFKFEQCLVKGCHKRIRIVHTIEFINGGSEIQIMRVAVYEEEWVGPTCVDDQSGDMEFDLKPFSQRKRTKPSELTGSWKVFEISATPVYSEETNVEEGDDAAPYVYLCTETLKKRSSPESTNYFGEEERLDMQDMTVLWLPGGVTCYVDINNDGILCIGVGWYSDEGINLVMERDYGLDGKLKDVRYKSEMKRRWSNV